MVCCTCVAVWAIVLGAVFFIWKKLTAKKTYDVPEIHKKDFVKDRIYLYQFINKTNHANPSPYCVKLDLFLRMNKFDVEVIPTMTLRSRYGKAPFLEVNGEHIADSQLAIERLKVLFPEKVQSLKLSTTEQATVKAVQRMVDFHTVHFIGHYKVIDQPENFIKFMSDFIINNWMPANYKWIGNYPKIFSFLLRFAILRKYKSSFASAIGPLVDTDLEAQFRRDLDVIKTFIEGHKFVGGEVPTEADATIYGHFAPCFTQGYRTRASTILNSDYPTLVAYLNRLHDQYFPELDALKIL